MKTIELILIILTILFVVESLLFFLYGVGTFNTSSNQNIVYAKCVV